MDLVFATECRLEKCLNGKIYSPDGSFTNKLWDRYLSVFQKVFVIARVLSTGNESMNQELLSESERVTIIELPYYIGPFQYIKEKNKISKIIENESRNGRAFICRMPGQIGLVLAGVLNRKGIEYGVEVVGDPWDVFAPGAIRHPLRPLIRFKMTRDLKRTIKRSSAVLYVTNRTLQKRYTLKTGIWETSVSNVFIGNDSLAVEPKKIKTEGTVHLISIGSLAQMYKSPDVLLKSVKLLKEKEYNVHLNWLGDGIYKEEMIRLTQKIHISDSVSFVGNVPAGEAVRQYLGSSDIFVLASRTEGLPRAMIEAMAMGLPCIGTRVGGIPELLDDSVLVKPNDAQELAEKIEYMINNPEFTNAQAERNLKEAFNYRDSVLQEKRIAFYNEIKRITLESISGRK